MPPQVGGPGPTKRPVVSSQNGVDRTKPGNAEKKTSPETQNPTGTIAPHRATPKEKSQKNTEAGIMGSVQKIALDELMKAEQEEAASSKKKVSGGTWFESLAKAMGEAAEDKAKKLQR